MRKTNILIDAGGNASWIGGLYYKKNIIFSLLQNETIIKTCNLFVTTTEDVSIFDSFNNRINVIKVSRKAKHGFSVFLICLFHHIDYVYPMQEGRLKKASQLAGIKCISWIPDFQHNHLTLFFNEEELEERTKLFNTIANNSNPLVLSSHNALDDFKRYYSSERKKIYIVPFVSYIEDTIKNLDEETEKTVLEKYNLYEKKYACIMNQFWQHKNHQIVVTAIRINALLGKNRDLKYVFTGNLSDYRNPEYIYNIKKDLEDPIVSEQIQLLGFIDRLDQIVIMKHAEYVIQPSLFEGWGTVLEDAKVLDKTVLLSDIPVHREQKNEKSILFDPYNAENLAQLMHEENKREHHDDISKGIASMYKRAKEYSKGFEKLLEEQRN